MLRVKADPRIATALSVPWKRVLLRWAPEDTSLASIYDLLGWDHSAVTRRGRMANIRERLNVLAVAKMADIVGADRGAFFCDMVREIELQIRREEK